MTSFDRILAITALFFAFAPAPAFPSSIRVGAFSAAGADRVIPSPWEHLEIRPGHHPTEYRLVETDRGRALQASSDSACSGLVRKLRLPPEEYPYLAWSWKISGILPDGDVLTREGDDCAARVLVLFDEPAPGIWGIVERTARKLAGRPVPSRALGYIWSNRAAEDAIVKSPYTDRCRMVVLRSGSADAGIWQTEERNILEDYRRAFGTDPPRIAGIALVTDSDNTGGSTVSWYGNIEIRDFSRAEPAP